MGFKEFRRQDKRCETKAQTLSTEGGFKAEQIQWISPPVNCAVDRK